MREPIDIYQNIWGYPHEKWNIYVFLYISNGRTQKLLVLNYQRVATILVEENEIAIILYL